MNQQYSDDLIKATGCAKCTFCWEPHPLKALDIHCGMYACCNPICTEVMLYLGYQGYGALLFATDNMKRFAKKGNWVDDYYTKLNNIAMRVLERGPWCKQ